MKIFFSYQQQTLTRTITSSCRPCRKFDRYSTIREVNKRAKSAIDDALSLICSFEPKIDVSFIRTLERECRHLDRDRSGMLKSEEIVDAVDRSMSLKLPPDEVSKSFADVSIVLRV